MQEQDLQAGQALKLLGMKPFKPVPGGLASNSRRLIQDISQWSCLHLLVALLTHFVVIPCEPQHLELAEPMEQLLWKLSELVELQIQDAQLGWEALGRKLAQAALGEVLCVKRLQVKSFLKTKNIYLSQIHRLHNSIVKILQAMRSKLDPKYHIGVTGEDSQPL